MKGGLRDVSGDSSLAALYSMKGSAIQTKLSIIYMHIVLFLYCTYTGTLMTGLGLQCRYSSLPPFCFSFTSTATYVKCVMVTVMVKSVYQSQNLQVALVASYEMRADTMRTKNGKSFCDCHHFLIYVNMLSLLNPFS